MSLGAVDSAHSTADESKGTVELPEDIEFDPSKHLVQNPASVHATAGESEEIIGLLEVCEWSEFSKKAGAAGVAATAGVSEGITGSFEVTESGFPSLPNSLHSSNSCLGSSTSACARVSRAARAVASARVGLGSSSSAESAAVAHAHVTTLHDAHNLGELVFSCRGPPATAQVCVGRVPG